MEEKIGILWEHGATQQQKCKTGPISSGNKGNTEGSWQELLKYIGSTKAAGEAVQCHQRADFW